MSCPICEKRKGVRFCPAKGEKICAVCCGTYREVSIDCPSSCTYLLSAHRYEDEHRRVLPADTPLMEIEVPRDLLHTHQQLIAALAFSIAKFCSVQPTAIDADILAAIQSLAETYKTLSSGIVYEKPPAAPLAKELYAAIVTLLAELKNRQADSAPRDILQDLQIFYLLVFIYRMGLLRSNGRPRSRRYIQFLRSQFPDAPELQQQQSRIIMP